MPRLFVALRPPPEIRAALLATMAGIEAARWQTDNQLHLTLAFLGEVDRHGAKAAADALGLVRSPPLDLKLGLPGTFDAARPGRTGTLWIGVEDDTGPKRCRHPEHDPGPSFLPSPETTPAPAQLRALAHSIRAALRRTGLTSDPRKFTPHITLARFGPPGAPREAIRPWLTHSSPPSLGWHVTGFHLVESTLGHEGAHYTPAVTYPLG